MGIRGKTKVVYFTRKQRPLGNFSVEIYFEQVRQNLREPFYGVVCEMPYYSNGFFKRLANTIYCIFKQGDINHITGDIHYVAAFLKKQKTILTILDCGMLHETKGIKHRLFKLFWFIIPVKKVTVITAISQSTKDDIIHFTHCDPAKIHVVYVCINPIFKRNDKDFNATKPVILQIGTATNKNLGRLAAALQNMPCKLVIIGRKDKKILQLLKQYNIDYEMLDRKLTKREMLTEYEKCDILSFVSTLEGFGMPIVEANTVGRVVITGDNSSMPEVAGNSAYLVNAFSVDDIKDGFVKIIKDPTYRNRLIENGYENCKRFSSYQITEQFMGIYKSMINLN